MEVAKSVKRKAAEKPHVGVKVLKKKPAKISLPSISKNRGTRNKLKADTVANSAGKTTKQREKIVKTTKSTRTENNAEDSEAENELEATKTDTTKDPKTAKKTQETGAVKKTKDPKTAEKTQETGTLMKTKQKTLGLDTSAGTSGMKVQKKKTKTVKIKKNEASDKKIKIIEEVFEAITINGQPRKGASSQAIKNYIFSKRGIENEATHKRVNKQINEVLKKAVESGELARPANSKGTASEVSAIGRFILAKKVPKSKVAKIPEVEEDSESNE